MHKPSIAPPYPLTTPFFLAQCLAWGGCICKGCTKELHCLWLQVSSTNCKQDQERRGREGTLTKISAVRWAYSQASASRSLRLLLTSLSQTLSWVTPLCFHSLGYCAIYFLWVTATLPTTSYIFPLTTISPITQFECSICFFFDSHW